MDAKQHQPGHAAHKEEHGMKMDHKKNYRNLLIMTGLSFISMYILMFAMVNTAGNIINNLNTAYMAALMAAPMVPIMLLLMRTMYPDRQRNMLLVAGSVIAMLLFFLLIRQQGAIGDMQFLRSMIPHHSSAILMCEKASLADPEIQQLCQEIIAGQQQEIDQMEAIMERLK